MTMNTKRLVKKWLLSLLPVGMIVYLVVDCLPGLDLLPESLGGVPTVSGLEKASTVVYLEHGNQEHDYGDMIGSGVYVGAMVKGTMRIFLVTVKHVAKNLGLPQVQMTVHREWPYSNVKRVAVPESAIKWFVDWTEADVAIGDVTDTVDEIEAKGTRIRYILLDREDLPDDFADSRMIPGVIGLTRNRWNAVGIGTGSEALAVCGDPESYTLKLGFARVWKAPYETRRGVMESEMAPLEFDFAVRKGNSGSPIFVYADENGAKRPFLCGLVTGYSEYKDTRKTYATPIDWVQQLVEWLRKRPDMQG